MCSEDGALLGFIPNDFYVLRSGIPPSASHFFPLQSLSSNDKVANRTANALATCCHESLLSCDLSFCRFMSDNALGLIVDSCTHLRELRVYGCAQITSKFLDGHSKDNLIVLR